MKVRKITEISKIKLITAQAIGTISARGSAFNCEMPIWKLPRVSSPLDRKSLRVPAFSEERHDFNRTAEQGFGRCRLNAHVVNDA